MSLFPTAGLCLRREWPCEAAGSQGWGFGLVLPAVRHRVAQGVLACRRW